MSETKSSRSILRSVAVVFGGFMLVIVLSLGTDVILHATGIYPPWFKPMADGLWLLATAYRLVYNIAGSYLAARLAPRAPMAHALATAVVIFALCIEGAVAHWNAGPEYGPKWFVLALIATALPCGWVGGKLGIIRSH